MKKVLMCGNHPSNKGGMTSVINQIMNYDWANENIKLVFIPTYKPGNTMQKSFFFLFSLCKILSYVLFQKPDLVHMHMSYKGSFTRKYIIHRLCKRIGIKDAIHLHGSEFEKWYNSSTSKKKDKIRRMLREADHFIVLGEKWKNIVLNIEPKTNVIVISNGIKVPPKKVEWNEKSFNVVFLGVLIPRKGLVDLLEAIALLKNRKQISNMKFLIAGTGESENELKSKTKELNIESHVNFLGWTRGKEKEDLLANSQIMISPSYNEGLPISLLEAISYGMPVISTKVGDIPSAVENNKNGFLIEPGDILGLARALIELLNKDTFCRMAIESKKIAMEKFDIKLFYNKLKEIYLK